MPSTPNTEALTVFDKAVAAELPRVSHVEYDSHEICKHFAAEVRKRLASTPAAEVAAEPIASVFVSGSFNIGRAIVFQRWESGAELLSDGEHHLYTHPQGDQK